MITWTNAPGTGRSAVPGPSAVPGAETGAEGSAGTGTETGAAPDEPSPAEALAARIAERVLACDGVAGLTAGPHGRVATYRAGPPFAGVAVRDGVVEVGVVARYGRPLPLVAEDVRGAVRPLSEGRSVDVLIGDVLTGA
ncbi:hypothetical protein [Actinomadura algeriensis]|uniref:Asp23/Gls24 family envelope stress response protein n=1 Tax=Actinomadura algeriensis TaxID=1679523 RepID=A0ABR9JKV9_9ACTN|nr:hypothetical protein [Actinomadura algeriensis]MBE1531016.1 hypothetical protein [Actinomadura algeriensis]